VYVLDNPGFEFRQMQEFFSVLDNTLTISGKNPDSYSVVSGLFPGIKAAEASTSPLISI
jgi:hypothetical protein